MPKVKWSGVILGALFCAACASTGSAPVRYADGVLVNSSGMTLYTFENDTSGKSVCNNACAANWPPVRATAGDRAGGGFTVIARDDGSMQWAYQGKPLYLWNKDLTPGDRGGDGVNKVWHVVKETLYTLAPSGSGMEGGGMGGARGGGY